MTRQEAANHWRERSKSELAMAKALLKEKRGDFLAGALFHCSLSLELALKAMYIEEHGEKAPFTHDLAELAYLLKEQWSEAQLTAFEDLSEFAVLARYGDEKWLEEQATPENASKWVQYVETFLSFFKP